jgi:hypothetical protein
MKSYEEIIKDVKENIETLNPQTISTYSVQLAMYMGFVGEQLARADVDYNKKWEETRIKVDTDGRAERKSKGTEEYYNKKRLEVQYQSLKELVNALKRRLGVLSDEAQSKY